MHPFCRSRLKEIEHGEMAHVWLPVVKDAGHASLLGNVYYHQDSWKKSKKNYDTKPIVAHQKMSLIIGTNPRTVT